MTRCATRMSIIPFAGIGVCQCAEALSGKGLMRRGQQGLRMRRFACGALAALLLPCIAACSKSTGNAAASPSPLSQASTEAYGSPGVGSVAPTLSVSFTDLAGNMHAAAITALGELGVLDNTTGGFNPDQPVKRRDFVRWLFKTNNAVFADSRSHQIHRGRSDETPVFTDLPSSDPDFPYVEGMNDAGIAVGFPDRTFKGDKPITREQAVSVKSLLDRGGLDSQYTGHNILYLRNFLPPWKDRDDVSITYIGAIGQDRYNEGDTQVANIGRTFGAISVFRPRATVTRGEAAEMLQRIGGRYDPMRTVPGILHGSPTASP